MKKFVLLIVLLAGISYCNEAAAQIRFYYYPASNVYYNPATNQYIYPAATGWTTVSTLPSAYQVNNASRVTVYSKTPDVWTGNHAHRSKYKTNPAPKGKATGYKGTHPNRAGGKAKSINRDREAPVTSPSKAKQHGGATRGKKG